MRRSTRPDAMERKRPTAVVYRLEDVRCARDFLMACKIQLPPRIADAAFYNVSSDTPSTTVFEGVAELEYDPIYAKDLVPVAVALGVSEDSYVLSGFHTGLRVDDAARHLEERGYDVRPLGLEIRESVPASWGAAIDFAARRFDAATPNDVASMVRAVPRHLWRVRAMREAADDLVTRFGGELVPETLAVLCEYDAVTAGPIEAAVHVGLGRTRKQETAEPVALEEAVRTMERTAATREMGSDSHASVEVKFDWTKKSDDDEPNLLVSDCRWSPDGRLLAIVKSSVRIFERTNDHVSAWVEGIADGFGLAPIIDYPPETPSDFQDPHVPYCVDFFDQKILTGTTTGEVLLGSVRTNWRHHGVWHRFGKDQVQTVRVAPRSKKIALCVGPSVVLVDGLGGTPRVLESDGHFRPSLAWALDEQTFARLGGDLLIYDADGRKVFQRRVNAVWGERPGKLAASPQGFVVPTYAGLLVIDPRGSERTIPFSADVGTDIVRVGGASVTADGRVVAVRIFFSIYGRRSDHTQLIDLERGRSHRCDLFIDQEEFSPTGDARTEDGRVHPWFIARRDESAEWVSLAQSLRSKHPAIASMICRRLTLEPHRRRLKSLLAKVSADLELRANAVSPPKPLPLRPPGRVAMADDGGFAEGAAVRHARFGQGVVEDVSGTGPRALVTVTFDDGTERRLPASTLSHLP